MIEPQVVDAFNNRMTVDLNSIKTMTPAQKDRVKLTGSAAEALLKNRDFAQFVHQFKFERLDVLSEINGHTEDDNRLRVSVANQLTGIDEFVKSLKRAVYFRDRVVTQQQPEAAEEPNS
jgi:hypothetical protein